VLGLTALGAVHTAISLVAIVAGVWALARDGEILLSNRLGKYYLLATVLTAATGLMIYRHGGFRIGHAFAILTLLVVAIGTLASASRLFGRASPYLQAAFYSSTMLIHMITGSAETLTRLPPGAPLVTAANAFIFKDIIGALLLLYLAGIVIQFRLIHKRNKVEIAR
jgi:uncharacterized membrane protein